MKPVIRREKWKGKFRIVARRKDGALLSHCAWSQKFPLQRARNVFKKNGSFNPDLKVNREDFTNVEQVTDFSSKPRIRRTERAQGYARITVRVGRKIITEEAVSRQEDMPVSIRRLKDEAEKNAKGKIVERLGYADGSGQGDQLNEIDDLELISIQRGVLYYRKKASAAV